MPYVKREVTNRGIHVPFIVRNGNKAGAGTTDTALHSFVDMAPSMLSLAGVVVPDYMQGQAFLGKQASKKERQYVFAGRDRLDTEYDRVRSVRDRRYQYLRNYFPEKSYYMNVKYRQQQPMMVEMLKLKSEGKLNDLQMRWFLPKGVTEELYDLENDPHQFNNLANNPAYHEKFNELKKAMDLWISNVGDMGAVEENKMVESQWPGGVQPITLAPTMVFKNGKSTLSCSTSGASIAFKVFEKDSQEPAGWQLYTGPFVKKSTHHVKAVAIRIGFAESAAIVFN